MLLECFPNNIAVATYSQPEICLETPFLSGDETLHLCTMQASEKGGWCTKCRTLSPELRVHVQTAVFG